MIDLSGRSAVVTGGARGIGRAIVRTLAQGGADVIIADMRCREAELAAQEISKETGRRVEQVCTDVTQLGELVRLRDEAIRRVGKIDILVNNAGWDRLTPFLKTTPELWDKVIAINYRGVIHEIGRASCSERV